MLAKVRLAKFDKAYPRDEDFRLGAEYAERCRATSAALHEAMDTSAA